MKVAGTPLVSAIVVSYNVRDHLLEALRALDSTSDLPMEIIVVDNASSDRSAEAVMAEFPEVNLIREAKNIGYGRANNAGLEKATGRFILLVNPDLVVEAGCVGKLTDFLLARPEAAAVSPRIQRPDGSPDLAARRGFPTPMTSFYRLSGLSRLFPRSLRFNRYNMGYLSDSEVHEIDSGTGACLMLRRSAIERVGLFDPDFFMYGEDLDLCLRLKDDGWKVFYQPDAHARHVKGASSRQATLRMLYHFHRSMWVFHLKHYAGDLSAFSTGLVWLSIWARWAFLAGRAIVDPEPRVSP
ncbi:MAG TPA: glycosyltransferase family 2 protein [Candidatus Acidoferrales bacterium]|nr:glycosyltransferase family 2 protein [Candidatus Acidoferrales bacterium]